MGESEYTTCTHLHTWTLSILSFLLLLPWDFKDGSYKVCVGGPLSSMKFCAFLLRDFNLIFAVDCFLFWLAGLSEGAKGTMGHLGALEEEEPRPGSRVIILNPGQLWMAAGQALRTLNIMPYKLLRRRWGSAIDHGDTLPRLTCTCFLPWHLLLRPFSPILSVLKWT